MSMDINIGSILLWVVLAGVGVIGYFVKGLIQTQKDEVKISRGNERELYKEISRVELAYWKDQCEQARKSK